MGWGGGGRGRERGLHSDRTLELGRGSPLITQFSITQPVCVSELPEARKGTSQKSEGAVTPRANINEEVKAAYSFLSSFISH